MSRENVKLVGSSYEAFAHGDTQAALAAYSHDTEWDDTRFRPEGKVHRGREELSELVRTWVGTWTDYSIELERVEDAGDRVVVIYRERGTGKGSGLEVNTQVGLVVTVQNGEIIRTVVYSTAAEALEAVGLSE
jgi:ketosteroid isomerase-like protein